ncbi:helicase HerA-like domain-containing protein [Pyrobaculum aerophilum]|uniref:helicase HerA-like domain-containing protein n=1 Tax=Pyrobaculum aerophilum TaxID=13773 RepID=UPI0011C0270B|nr:helicase HerA-like domain-containing protein [Pyrobaculum aerophilum]
MVFDITALSADSAAQMLWAAVLLIYLVSKYMREKSEKLQTVIVFDEARLLSKHGVRGGETLIAMIEDLVQGGRKFGFGVWFILQLETQLPHDLVRSAALQLILGGNEMFVRGAAQTLYLEQTDVNFLLAARTPGEAALGGQPMAMGLLRMAPRNIKYHVYIPLDTRLKPQR